MRRFVCAVPSSLRGAVAGEPLVAVAAVLLVLPLAGGCAVSTSHTTTPAAQPGSPSAAPAASAKAHRKRTPGGPPPVTTSVLGWRLPAPRSRSVAMRYAGGALLAGGLLPGDRSNGTVLRISFHHDRVQAAGRMAALAEPMHDSAGLVLHGRPTIFGGGSSVELSGVQQLSPAGRWRVVGRLPGARSDLSVVGARGAAYLVGGYDGVHTPPAVLVTRDGSRFRRLSSLPGGDRYAGVATVGHDIWVLGGEADGEELDRVARIDLRTGRVEVVGRTPVGLGHEAVVRVGSRLLVMGGRTAPGRVTDAMWWFDPRTLKWRRAGRLPYPVADAPVVVHGRTAYLFGGERPAFTAKVTRVAWR